MGKGEFIVTMGRVSRQYSSFALERTFSKLLRNIRITHTNGIILTPIIFLSHFFETNLLRPLSW